MLSLTLADFIAALPFSKAIEDAQIQPFVARSLQLDIEPPLGWPVLEAVQALSAGTLLHYDAASAYPAGSLVVRRERVYEALLATNGLTIPAASNSVAEWAYLPLRTLWTQYLKTYWLHASFGRYLAQTGFDVTKAGLTTPTDPQGTFRPVSSADRATVQAAIDTTTEGLRSRLTAFLHGEQLAYAKDAATGYDYGQATQACATSITPRTRLRGINRRR